MTRKPFGEKTWFTLAAALVMGAGCGGTSASTSSTEAPATPAPTAASALASDASFDKTSDWGTGFCGDLHVPNATGQTINGWEVDFALASNVRLSSVWNGQWTVLTTDGSRHAVSNLSWNAQVAPGAELTIGMCGTYSGTFIAPFTCRLNGASCGGDIAPVPPATDTTPPTVSISANSLSITSPQDLAVSFSATDDVGVTRLVLLENGVLLGEKQPYTRSFTSPSQNGTYVYEADAFDLQGNKGTRSLTVTVSLPGDPPPSDPTQPGTARTEYAPYFYTWGWGNSSDYSFKSLMELHTKAGLNAVTLAFVLGNSAGGNPCSITNDGTTNLIETQMVSDIQAFQAAGGHIKVSFGGANGLNLDSPQACTNADYLSNALIGFVQRTGLTDLDFDVEQNEVLTPQVNAKRAQALRLLQQVHPEVKVSFTLAALPRDQWNTPGGLLPSGVDVVRSALQAGVVLSHVNLMTMDYGSYYSSGHNMGDLANSALRDAHDQLKSLLPSLTDAQTWAMLGATPMIGRNDISSETFSLDDARILVEFVNNMGVGLVSFWAIQRDQPCPYTGLDVCSEVNTRAFEFNDIFKTVHQ